MIRKAQMEIMGLAVIVILLAVGMFFVARFSLSSPQTSQAQSFQQRQVSVGFVNTLLSTSVDGAECEGSSATFAKLIEEMTAPEFSLLRCGDGNLDVYFTTSVEDILIKTLEPWGYKYKLTIIFPTQVDKIPIEITKGCEGTTQEEAAPPFPIPTDYGDVRVIMKICY